MSIICIKPIYIVWFRIVDSSEVLIGKLKSMISTYNNILFIINTKVDRKGLHQITSKQMSCIFNPTVIATKPLSEEY